MKSALVAAAIAAMGTLGVMPSAHAVTQYGRTWMWFDANENLVGQSILYCDNTSEHQGTTSTAKRVIISYACETRQTNAISYTDISTELRADFCDTWGQGMCEEGPWANGYLTSPWTSGLYN
ncbi:DUF6289 family protein [Pseudoxanthomonas winnipegensis]|uniref:DUF6289 family protein n=1 Tax=Pseudoxanthomonas winnipegensis TaxID=2480810 RepID=UPI00103D0D48|nr:DUF6289 family protein [Pseudoxanthomonas winnipegensis]TBV76235.1 hypothetical protein EYC45_03585 [Pseudoxanthomonas winnipegensis]